MKLKNVEVGQRVVIKRSTHPTWDRPKRHIGEEFEVTFREGPDYPKEGGTVRVRKCDDDSVVFWCNHRDLGRIEPGAGAKKPLKVGDKVIVKAQPAGYMFPVGTEGEVTDVGDSAPEYKVAALGDYWFYTRAQLKRVKAPKQKPVEAPKRDIKAELAAAWPWPEGTPVRFSESGDYPQWVGRDGYTLGSDGSDLPPIRDPEGKHLGLFADPNDVLLNTEYQSWTRASSREVSDLNEEQRTGPLRACGAGTRRVTIEHSIDVEGVPRPWYYEHGDYRDNGDGTGTVLTLEEIFLNGLKK